MMLTNVMTNWLEAFVKPRLKQDEAGRALRKTLLPLLGSCLAYRLDDETVRACQSVGPKFASNGREIFKRWRPPAQLLWVEFNADVVKEELVKTKYEVHPIFPDSMTAELNRRDFGYLIDSRHDDGISIWLIKDRRRFIFGPAVEMFIPYDENGNLNEICDVFYTGCAGPHILQEDIDQEVENIRFGIDIPIIFSALLNARNPVFEVSEAPSGFAKMRVQKAATAIGAAGKIRLPRQMVIKLSDMGKMHNAAIEEEREVRQEDRIPGEKRKTPRLHLVRGHTFIRNGNVYWKNPHVRGKGEAGVTLVKNDVPGVKPDLRSLDDYDFSV